MTNAGVDAFVDSILTDRSPEEFTASPDDLDVLRVAIQQRAARGEFAGPDPQFVEDLHRQLAASVQDGAGLLPLPLSGRSASRHGLSTTRGYSRARPGRTVRRFSAAGKAAAAAALVMASTFTVTSLAGRHSSAPVAGPTTGASTVRSGVLLSADGRRLGTSYAYSGHPSWVFMDVHGSAPSGVYTCELHLVSGATVPAGVVVVYNGSGDWAHTVRVPVSQLRQATLVTSSGATVATADFS